ncbi:MAG: Ppx/GppA family phosphatase [Rickettsiales bacterium]|jgi:exopolyphosphatase/guanosine-5'-triphosphate,3'-diphosphate pyrophosphatase
MVNETQDARIGIIDIGSNSIRLVVYDRNKRSPIPIYNEKVLCALGKGLSISGVLNPEGVVMGKNALRRFVAMGHNMKITELHVIATSAIREAKDGRDFTRWLEQTYDVKANIISGEEEARLGAYAVCSSIHRPQGITADLGGGSLELVRVDGDIIGGYTSLPLGSLRMIDESKGDRDKLREIIDQKFAEINWLDNEITPNIYAIGGSFRALAKMHMMANNYPLQILHEYTVDAKKFLCFVREIISLSIEKLEKYPGSAAKRSTALPGAAMVLESLIITSKPEKIIFSASGIREGYVYKKLPARERDDDGLLFSCREFASHNGRSISYGQELFEWMELLVPHENDRMKRLRLAFCLLSDIALHIHPEYRAQWAFQRIIYSAFNSLTHVERVILALALYHRYRFRLKENWAELKLLNNNDKILAKLWGTSANLAYHLSGSITDNLHKAPLVIKNKNINLEFTENMEDVMGDAIQKRIDGLKEAYKEYIEIDI